jgi:hypothetical protein
MVFFLNGAQMGADCNGGGCELQKGAYNWLCKFGKQAEKAMARDLKEKIKLLHMRRGLAAERQKEAGRLLVKWDWQSYPCPHCQQQGLVYDGSVIWSNGPRPPRGLATKAGFPGYRRADFEVAHYFHCGRCGTNFYDQGLGRPGLRVE